MSDQTAQTPGTPAAPAAPAPGTPEHDAAMAAKASGVQMRVAGEPVPTTPATPAQRPADVPEKFWDATKGEVNVSALLKSYGELERGKSTPATPPATKPADKLGIPTQDANQAVQNAGLDMAALQQEWAENGDLKPETYTKLEQSGIPKPMVDAYVAGQKALAAEYDAAAHAAAGGQEQYGQLVEWAKSGLTDQEKVAFNAAVSSGDKATMQLAVSGLKARFTAAHGSIPTTTLAGKGTPATDVYESMAQVTADMKKPEYKNDPAFRAKVYAKLDRSDIGAMKTVGMS